MIYNTWPMSTMEDSITEREVLRWLLACNENLFVIEHAIESVDVKPGELFGALMRRDVHTVVQLLKSTSIDALYLSKAFNERRHFDVVTHLLNCHKFDPQYRDRNGNNLLHTACILFVTLQETMYRVLQSKLPKAGSRLIEVIQYAIERCHCDPQIKNCKGALPLHIACCSELVPLEAVELLSNCDVNTGLSSSWEFDRITKLVQGDTPLHVACLNGSEEIVRYLIEKCNCNPRITNGKGALPLHAACARSDSLMIARLVSSCDVNTGLSSAWEFKDRSMCEWDFRSRKLVPGDTPLHIACLCNSIYCVEYLIETCHCDPQIENCNGVLPLHFACANGSLNIVRLISNCDVNAAVKRSFQHTSYGGMNRMIVTGDTPLQITTKFWQKLSGGIVKHLINEKHCQVWYRDYVSIKYFLNDDHTIRSIASFLGDSQDEDGNTILHIVCRSSVEVSQIILEVKCLSEGKYCSPCVQNNEGELPLHVACRQEALEVVKLVSNCDVCSKTKTTGDTPLHVACKYSTVEVVKYLIEQHHCDPTAVNNSDETCLETAEIYGQLDVVKYLIDIMDLQHTYIIYTRKLLHCAIIHERVETVECIVLDPSHQHERGGTIVNIPNDNGELAIHIACRQNSLDIVELISDYTYDINATAQKSGDTALHIACRKSTIRFVKYLIEEKQCNPNIPNNNGELPLHIACREQATEIARLVSYCDIDFPTELGNTPLHEACGASTAFSFPTKSLKIITHLISHKKCKVNVRNKEGKTAIHYACKAQSVKLVNYLLLNGKADLSVADNEGQTPLMFVTNPALIKVLLHHGADPRPLYKSFAQYFRDHSSENPLPTPQKILVVGNARAGKTSLIQSLESEGEKSKEQCEPQPTAGIIPTNFQSDIYGPVIWYDFAGQKEYYASHEAILHNLIAFSPPVVLLVVDISKNEANVRHDLLYWLSFLKAQCTSTRGKPHLIVIGSHADMVRNKGIDRNWKLQQVIRNVKLIGEIPMDCRQSRSSGIYALQKCLKSSCSHLRTDTVVGFTCHCFYVFLLDRFNSEPAITIQQIIDAIDEAATQEDTDELNYVFDTESASSLSSDDSESSSDLDYQASDIIHLLPEKTETMRYCEDLNDRGHIMLVKDPHQCEHSWVILKKEEILNSVNGTVFAPLEFTEHKDLASSTGVVPFSKLATHFSDFNPNMLIGFLSQLEFCREIEDHEILKLICRENSVKSDDLERYFFFPGLVSITRPEGVWRPNEYFNYKCGFILHCSETDKFFTPRFLQVLILRLAFSFAFILHTHSFSTAIDCRCGVWKNGISWINENGIESVIEVLEDFQAVVVMLRCITGEENEVKCVFHRSSVIQTVLSTRAEICPQVSTTELFVHPSNVEYPPKVSEGITLFSLSEVARAISNAKPCFVSDSGKKRYIELLKVEDLLCFEPYSDSGEEVLKEIFDDNNCNKEVSDEFIYRITDSIAHRAQQMPKKKWLMKMLELPFTQLQEQTNRVPEGPTRELIGLFQTWRQCTAGTYQCLRETLDRFSVFCGRNPLELGTTQSQPNETVHEKFLGNRSESAASSQRQSDQIQAGMSSILTGHPQNESVSTSEVRFSSCPQGGSIGAIVRGYGYQPMHVSPHPSGAVTIPPTHPTYPTHPIYPSQPQPQYPLPSYSPALVPPWCHTLPTLPGYPHLQTVMPMNQSPHVAYSSSSSSQVKGVPSDVIRQQEARDDPFYGERPSKKDLQCLRWRNGDRVVKLRLMDLLAPNWRDVGIALGLEQQLDSIEEECLRKPKRCIEKLFGEWLTKSSDCSWSRLITALDDAGICSDLLKKALASRVDR